MYTRRYSPLRGLSFSSWGGFQPLTAAFYAVFAYFWRLIVNKKFIKESPAKLKNVNNIFLIYYSKNPSFFKKSNSFKEIKISWRKKCYYFIFNWGEESLTRARQSTPFQNPERGPLSITNKVRTNGGGRRKYFCLI